MPAACQPTSRSTWPADSSRPSPLGSRSGGCTCGPAAASCNRCGHHDNNCSTWPSLGGAGQRGATAGGQGTNPRDVVGGRVGAVAVQRHIPGLIDGLVVRERPANPPAVDRLAAGGQPRPLPGSRPATAVAAIGLLPVAASDRTDKTVCPTTMPVGRPDPSAKSTKGHGPRMIVPRLPTLRRGSYLGFDSECRFATSIHSRLSATRQRSDGVNRSGVWQAGGVSKRPWAAVRASARQGIGVWSSSEGHEQGSDALQTRTMERQCPGRELPD